MAKHILNSLIFFCGMFLVHTQNPNFQKQLDSIQKLRKLAGNDDLDIETKIKYLELACTLSNKTKVDSVILTSNDNLAHHYLFRKKYYEKSKELSYKGIKLAKKMNHRFEANFKGYLGYIYTKTNKNDSAYYYYYKSIKILEDLSPELKTEKTIEFQISILDNIGYIQAKEQDYVGSQVSLIRALNLLKTYTLKDEAYYSWDIYNSLGNNLKNIKNYKKAIEYYDKGIEIGNKLKDNFKSNLYLKINKAEAYKKRGDYNEVFKIYNELLKNKKLESSDPSSYATILNNMAYSRFLSGNKNNKTLDSLFTKAYHIFDTLNLKYELSASGNDIAEFYHAQGKKEKALYYTKRSYKFGKEVKDYEETLRALKLLSRLKEGEAGKFYLYEYVKLRDSLIDIERLNRNKYARIKYETDTYIKETERLSSQNILIATIAGIVVLVAMLLYLIKRQSTKHKLLLYEQDQQQAGQEIYRLMLDQQKKQEEGRLEERHRISEEMHDGILSHLFGARLGLAFLPIEGDEETKKRFKALLEELQEVEKEIRDISHQLKVNESITKTNYESLLKRYITTQGKLGKFVPNINNSVSWNEIPDTIKVGLYRVLQEALKNIIKHANTKQVDVYFALKETNLKVNIKDYGVGFDTNLAREGIGLENISSRIKKLKGNFVIKSKIGKGTDLQIVIPIG